MRPKLLYAENGRSGYVIYKDALGEIRCYYEFGGGNCVAIIDIPSNGEWISETQRPLTDRDPIIRLIADQVIHDKAPRCHAVIRETAIEIFE